MLATAPRQLHNLQRLPLNQEANKFLLQAQEEPDPSLQPLYQLLLWGLSKGGLTWPFLDEAAEPYQLFLERLAVQRDQLGAYNYLLLDPSLGREEPRLEPGDLAAQRSPREAAVRLLDVFQDALTADQSLVPSYPPTTEAA